jgi:hypothetical protein
MAFTPNHPLLWALIRELPHSCRMFADHHDLLKVGPHFLSRLVHERFPNALVLPPRVFCPVWYHNLKDATRQKHPSSYAAHLWHSVVGADAIPDDVLEAEGVDARMNGNTHA